MSFPEQAETLDPTVKRAAQVMMAKGALQELEELEVELMRDPERQRAWWFLADVRKRIQKKREAITQWKS